ncbi:hypothetical protein LSAT2_001664 [Lamellibrachia satsuma]|nr:hypothetical protein LSAT2_001664 [Lamellibrachia satsuma]
MSARSVVKGAICWSKAVMPPIMGRMTLNDRSVVAVEADITSSITTAVQRWRSEPPSCFARRLQEKGTAVGESALFVYATSDRASFQGTTSLVLRCRLEIQTGRESCSEPDDDVRSANDPDNAQSRALDREVIRASKRK